VTAASGDFQHTRWSAHDGLNGPSGAVWATAVTTVFGTFDVRGKVTCVDVNGNQADVAALLSEPGPNAATHVELFIVDVGNPVNGMSPDQVFVSFSSSPPTEPNCSFGGFKLPGEQHGNAIVRDDA
jgi:hypothetical protein